MFDILLRYSLDYADIEPAVALGETRQIAGFHLHLGAQLTQEHFPLVLIAQTADHLRNAHGFLAEIVPV